MIDDLDVLDPDFRSSLESLAAQPRHKGWIKRKKLEAVIIALCQEHYFTLASLAVLVQRTPSSLRNRYLNPMVRDGILRVAFPATPTHPNQSYTSAS